MSTNVIFFYHRTHLKAFKTYFNTASALYISEKSDVVYSNVITNDAICVPFVTTLLKRSGEAKIDMHQCILAIDCTVLRHSWTVGYVINGIQWTDIAEAEVKGFVASVGNARAWVGCELPLVDCNHF